MEMMLNKSALLTCQQTLLKNILYCNLCTASVVQSKQALKLTRKFLLQNEGKKRRVWHDGRIMTDPSSLVQTRGNGVKSTHRLRVLNKVFLDKITDIMATGEVSAQLSGLDLEISEVRVLPNLLGINVHWICSGANTDNHIEAVLQRNAKPIRHELSQQRVIGHVPPITFVKDHRFYKLQEVEQRLSTADFGEDFEPTDPTHKFKSSLALNMTLNSNLKEAIKILEDKNKDPCVDALKNSMCALPLSDESAINILPHDLPPMRDDVLGVNTQNIYRKVHQGIIKGQANHRKNTQEQGVLNTTSVLSRTQEIRQWASKYNLLRKKESRIKNKVANLLRAPPRYIENVEEEEYINEEDDYFEEFDLANDIMQK
ncbi:uncharacterized protein LOC121873298 [Homarus americanus]|uniref:Ribosome-binding factor A-like n=1 Tax=Homarus americanus TaxID=6706 RepID=A0A8J5JXB0_HOMAM|nr:uncharacterized protein LOC121873298 [Homarus americanus]XP_042232718.1 uncharacterized protein LOC121873298 [Homarus americanus]XP_042232720.1 uncharacterized protein LOC121873298 [Homarus americanus]KAG7163154.1 ribosome-binding factor A-like [Homarus americanus]